LIHLMLHDWKNQGQNNLWKAQQLKCQVWFGFSIWRQTVNHFFTHVWVSHCGWPAIKPATARKDKNELPGTCFDIFFSVDLLLDQGVISVRNIFQWTWFPVLFLFWFLSALHPSNFNWAQWNIWM
jgi:hypothetical protein